MNSLSAKIHYLLVFIPLFVITSCNDDEIVYPEGGYPYLKNVATNDTNFYFLPIRSGIGRKDSINIVIEKMVYALYNEPNLSIKPPSEDLFRFNYYGWPGETAIITLDKNRIIIKEARTDTSNKEPSENILDSVEQLHYNLFDVQYHLSDPKFPKWRKKIIDSLLKVYPLLFDPAYYLKLINKKFPVIQPFLYSTKEIEISHPTFKKIVTLINNSDYWKRSFNKTDCMCTDGEGFYLEAITKQKYQSIYFDLCCDDSSNLKKAYNEILKYAGVEAGKLGSQDTISVKSTEKVQVRELTITDLKPEPKKKKKKTK